MPPVKPAFSKLCLLCMAHHHSSITYFIISDTAVVLSLGDRILRHCPICILCVRAGVVWADWKMKKSKADNTSVFDAHRQNFVGKVYTLSRCQVVVEDVIAEGLFISRECNVWFVFRTCGKFFYLVFEWNYAWISVDGDLSSHLTWQFLLFYSTLCLFVDPV